VEHKLLTGDEEKISRLYFSADESLLASVSEGGVVVVWDTKDWTPAYPPLTGHRGNTVAFSPDGKWIAAANQTEHAIQIWSVETGDLLVESQAGVPPQNSVIMRQPPKDFV
jgi:WD40 repeat protein